MHFEHSVLRLDATRKKRIITFTFKFKFSIKQAIFIIETI